MITLADRTHISALMGQAQQLITADTVWTAHAPRVLPHDVETLRLTVGHMTGAMGALRGEGPFLTQVAGELTEDDFHRALDHSGLHDDVKAAASAVAARSGGWVPAATSRMPHLDEVMTNERAGVERELATLRAQRPSDGDMTKLGRCIVGWVMVVGGAITETWPVFAAGCVLVANNC